MSQQPDTYNILEIKCMHSSDSARLFVDRCDYDQLRSENAALKAEIAEVKKAAEQREDLQDVVSKALRKAWQLGQTYWQQADSESYSQNKRADDTYANFQYLVHDTLEAMKGK